MSGGPSRAPYFEHDDRVPLPPPNRRFPGAGKFKGRSWRSRGRQPFPNKQGGGRDRPRNVGFDEDVEMERSEERRERFQPYMDRRNRRNKNNATNRKGRRNYEFNNYNRDTWFKVEIPQGALMSKNELYKILSPRLDMPFVPYNYRTENKTVIFYVDDNRLANTLRRLSKQITGPTGFKIAMYVTPCPSPDIQLNAEIANQIKESMEQRYDTMTGVMRLDNFVDDTGLKRAGHYAPLHRTSIMSTVMRIIKENVPQLVSLDLSDNKLTTLEPLSTLVSSCKLLKSLNLRNNRLKSINELNSVKGMVLEELILDGNPLCDDFKDQQSFVSAVRQRLPKVVKLDGQDLPPPIGFDLGTTEALPESKGSFFPSADVKEIVIRFLEEYFRWFDSENRQGLLAAYHDNALFSLSVSKVTQRSSSLQDYLHDSRNLLHVSDSGVRNKLLRQGKLNVVSTFSQMPLTQHDPNSFTVDVAYVLPTLMCFAVSGVFKEVGVRDVPLRAFTRTFLVVPFGEGFVIINEMMFLTNATPEQEKAFKLVTPTPNPSPGPSNEKTMEEKQQIVIEFMKLTNMNEPFSIRCLEESDWDFQKAAGVFATLNKFGKIPPEAFKK